MRFQFCSDLHLERRSVLPTLEVGAEYLCLLGDIGRTDTAARKDMYETFLHHVSKEFQRVFLVEGNHERYDSADRSPLYRKLGIEHLENRHVDVGHVRLAGSTLYTPYVNQKEFDQAVAFFNQTRMTNQRAGQRLVFLSHYPPSWEMCEPKYYQASNLHRFYNSLDVFMQFPSAPEYWLCGHTHSRLTRRIHHTICRVNACSHDWLVPVDTIYLPGA